MASVRERRGHLDGHLVGGATDTAGAHLEGRGEGVDGRFELLEGVLPGLLSKDLECVVDDPLGRSTSCHQSMTRVDHSG